LRIKLLITFTFTYTPVVLYEAYIN